MPSHIRKRTWFTRFAKSTARAAGHPATFCAALAIIVIWAVSGPLRPGGRRVQVRNMPGTAEGVLADNVTAPGRREGVMRSCGAVAGSPLPADHPSPTGGW